MEYIVLGIVLILLIKIFSTFRPSPTQEIVENLYVVRCGFVNFYVYKSENAVILFDTGINSRGLKKLGIPAETVTHIFLTHTDADHAGGAKAFPNATLYISKEEEQMINGKTARRGFTHNKRLSKYKTIDNGENIVIDNVSIQTYVKSGHTPGSSIFLIDERYLATGDLLRISKKGIIKPFLWLMNKNHKQNIESLTETKDIIDGAEYILTGHTGFYKLN